jgi:hypothetical protein
MLMQSISQRLRSDRNRLKKLTLSLFLCIAAFCPAQFPDEYSAFCETLKASDGHVFRQEIYRKERKLFLKHAYRDTSWSFTRTDTDVFRNFREFAENYDTMVHFLDIDGDNDLDCLFFGKYFPGTENHDVSLYFKTPAGYKVHHLGTWLTACTKTTDGYEITALKTPCCSDFMWQAMSYRTFTGLTDSIVSVTNQTFGWGELDDSPEIVNTDLLVSQPLQLLIHPGMGPEDFKHYTEDGGAVIGLVDPGTTIHIYNKLIIDGKNWYYVVAEIGNGITIRPEWNKNYFGAITTIRGWVML